MYPGHKTTMSTVSGRTPIYTIRPGRVDRSGGSRWRKDGGTKGLGVECKVWRYYNFKEP